MLIKGMLYVMRHVYRVHCHSEFIFKGKLHTEDSRFWKHQALQSPNWSFNFAFTSIFTFCSLKMCARRKKFCWINFILNCSNTILSFNVSCDTPKILQFLKGVYAHMNQLYILSVPFRINPRYKGPIYICITQRDIRMGGCMQEEISALPQSLVWNVPFSSNRKIVECKIVT